MTLSSQPYKGTRDYFPAEKQTQNYIFNVWRKVVESFGYEEYGAPILEPIDIYAAKSGQELVNDQTYIFNDRGGRTVAIRPEMTPSISRMVAARRQELAYPARLYSIANFMRYERPQRGREREFWQLNIDIFGVDDMAADIEIIMMSDALLKALGAKNNDFTIRINNRKCINFMMTQYLGLDEVDAQRMMKLFDRRNKITAQDFKEQALQIFGETTPDDARFQKIEQIVTVTSIDELPAELKQSPALFELKAVLEGVAKAGVGTAVFDASLMRGLDYYTGTVFEVFDTHPDNNRALFGGGRYDGLVEMFGAEPISAVGVAMGSTMIENFLTVRDLIPAHRSLTKMYIAVIGNALTKANEVATKLRSAGINTEVDMTSRKIDKKLKTATKKCIEYVLFVGEHDTDSFSLKNLVSQEEVKLSIKDIIARFA
ncbi:MAG: histidine--tRNA ligase [Candidatus Microsaccharimonas sossegonensis]|uniref:Histidine--tRNA ligase n=1 Tax=Candidatus Microsaccharimonas sossegonensis TaxID=2506948 RepID=A0A4Q0AI06_9BACT|nr:MAG: histidine--tRNA ligase [Candidatus Microsaccharimonas sossegonensis]